ncbi:hypothetical protein HanOQP8_Chr01g0015061 [Helianthus annuus]|nr:hypothetical protein HanOQP8_Chr01g0015061 [Helianthus annuus]
MSGDGSSSGARGRRRGPVARPRGLPQQVISQRQGRRIRYEGHELHIYAWCPVRREHPLLQFQVNSNEWIKLQKIIRTDLLEHWTIDWEWLGQMGARERVEELLGPMLVEMVNCDWPQYDELVVEFHSTFHHREGSFFEGDAVSFSLGRMLHVISIPQFAIASGFYAFEDTSIDEFTNGLRGVFVNPRELCVTNAELARFWGTIADRGFGKTNLITSVRDLIHRFVLKVFSTTLVGRKSGKNKANWIDLFLLMCRVEGRDMNLASVLAWSFGRSRRGGKRASLDMGPYITKLA